MSNKGADFVLQCFSLVMKYNRKKMLFSIDLNTFITILNFYGTIIIYFSQKYISYILPKEASVTYKFPKEQIYLANILASDTFPEGFLFGISAPIVDSE